MRKTFAPRYSLMILASAALAACGGQNRYAGMLPGDMFALATTEFEEGNYDNAVEVLDRLLVTHGDWERTPEARLMLANAYFQREDYLTARTAYQRFLDRYPTHLAAADASLGVCRSLSELAPIAQRDQAYTEEAMTNCRNVVIDYAGTAQSVRAAEISNELRLTLAEKEYLNGDFYFRRGMYFSAIKYYEFVANMYPESEFAPSALLGIYRSHLQDGYEDLAEDARRLLLERYPDSDAAAQIRLDGSGS